MYSWKSERLIYFPASAQGMSFDFGQDAEMCSASGSSFKMGISVAIWFTS